MRGQRRRGGAGLPAAVAFAVAALVAAPLGAQETRPLGTPVAGPDACGAGLVGAPGAEWL
ncbi:MAG: hypothetical protein GWN71_01130, partial [Gammaproteobacteria bacterium]|nr:hypothetical protein [Gammaproteobacteria bacterium]NIY06907.1 hypothetical protein [Gemmatimonadota bacterium]